MDKKEKTIHSELIYKGRILDLYKDDVVCPNGAKSVREVIRKGKAACVIALLNDKIILEKQYRYPYDEIMIEVPAGKSDGDEETKTTAIRELEEETGYKANTIKFLGTLYPTVAYTDELIDVYFATDLEKTHTHLDFDEELEMFLASPNEVEEMIKEGKIKDSKTIIAFYLYKIKVGY